MLFCFSSLAQYLGATSYCALGARTTGDDDALDGRLVSDGWFIRWDVRRKSVNLLD